MAEIIKKGKKSISLESGASLIELRMGEYAQGKTRFIRLTPSEAIRLAYSLLAEAEAIRSRQLRSLDSRAFEVLKKICEKLDLGLLEVGALSTSNRY